MSNNKTDKINAVTPDNAADGVLVEVVTGGKTTEDNDAEGNVSVYTHKFTQPFEWEGETYEEITFNFGRLKGRDVIAVETEMQASNEYALAPEISRSFQSKLAARAAEVMRFGSDAMDALSVQDFNKITNAARNFLLNTGF